ncbi:hypothetical protein Bca52824_052524 [Brassica carinata]|uniref:Uncharacterized protein n=1 Tax=Brassica carinata TaxID=52824 RepID=A0A8X7RA03_BRACI|nr:hypothetical protein Bca52824_052524 [Brassica carinata]
MGEYRGDSFDSSSVKALLRNVKEPGPANVDSSREDLTLISERETAEPSVTGGNKKRSAPDSSASAASQRGLNLMVLKKKKRGRRRNLLRTIELLKRRIKKKTARSHESSTPAASASAVKIPPAAPRTLVESGWSQGISAVEDLIFKDDTPMRARTKILSDGSMNYVIELYDSALKEAPSNLKQADKLARAKDVAIDHKTKEFKATIDKVGSLASRRLEDTTIASAGSAALSTSLVVNEDPLVPVLRTSVEAERAVNLLELSRLFD